jgi:hypothetical protein
MAQSNINYVNFETTTNSTSQVNGYYKRVLKNIETGNIIAEGGTVETPDKCKLTLKQHQKRMVYEMLMKEEMKYRVSSGCNHFVICDKVGSGKSICVLSLISEKPTIDNWVKNISEEKNIYFNLDGFKIDDGSTFLKTNLIVIPHSVYNQWKEYLSYFPNLTFYGVKTKTDLDKLKIEDLKEGKYNVLLVKSTKYNDFIKLINEKIEFNRSYTYNKYGESEDDEYNQFFKKYSYMRKNFKELRTKMQNKDIAYNYNLMFNALQSELCELQDMNFDSIKQNWKEQFIDTFNTVKGGIFERVIFDEANSIKIPNCAYAYGKYNWFITSSLNDLFFPKGERTFGYYSYYKVPKNVKGIYNQGFIRDLFSANQQVYNVKNLDKIYLKNNDEFIKNSFQLDDPIKNYIECYTPIEIQLLQQVDLPNIIDALNANDMETAISLVDGNIKSDTDITKLVLSKLEKKLNKTKLRKVEKEEQLSKIMNDIDSQKDIYENAKKKFKEFTDAKGVDEDAEGNVIISGDLLSIIGDSWDDVNEEYIDLKEKYEFEKKVMETLNSKKYSLKKSLETIEENLKVVCGKYEDLKERISNITEKNCPVCLEQVEKPTMTPCCKNIYCFSCLMYTLQSVQQCAICRNKIAVSQCTIIDNEHGKKKEEEEKKETALPKKIEKLMELITADNKNKHFLVFSSYEKSFDLIAEKLKENDITFSLLKGSTGQITNIIQDYKDNKFKVLLLNAKYFGSGLNLQMTSDIILYHRMDNELEKQIIGRGQRLGREGTLRVHYLCHKNEL